MKISVLSLYYMYFIVINKHFDCLSCNNFLFLFSEPNEHPLLSKSERVPIIVYDTEPSSIIAYALRWVLHNAYFYYEIVFCFWKINIKKKRWPYHF